MKRPIVDYIDLYFQPVREIWNFWYKTWWTSKLLFFAEMVGTLAGMSAASIVSLEAPHPNLLLAFILYNVSSLCFIYSNYVRESSWMIVLMIFYLSVTSIGLWNLI